MSRVSKKNPCPICGKPDGCLILKGGDAVLCSRTPSDKLIGDPFAGGWLHKLTGTQSIGIRHNSLVPDPPKPKVDIWPIHQSCKFKLHRRPELLSAFAQQLGVSERSLVRLEAGWDGEHYVFPMRDGNDRIVGISVRGERRKWCVPGSNNGLFWPVGIEEDLEGDGPLWFCEGPTDCAALLDLGFDAIGRQGCMGCTSEIVTLLKKLHQKKPIMIMSDKDAPKTRQDGSQWTPGLEGAMRLAEVVKPLALNLRVIMPPRSKDIRQWYNDGATKEVVLAVLANTRFF